MNDLIAHPPGGLLAQGKPRLLLAEDHPDTRELLHELLSPEYEVEAVMDGAQA